jgi:hypothetical protein
MVAMRRFIGNGKSRAAQTDSTEEIRKLRRGSRLDRLNER